MLEEASRLIQGPNRNPLPGPEAHLRMLRGQPWSVAALLARLAASDETVRSQRRLALELRVRTGLGPPTALPVFADAEARGAALARWTGHYARLDGNMPAGQWYYQGRPAKLAHREHAQGAK